MNTIDDKLAAALRACIDLAHNCPRDELADAIIKTVSNALAEHAAVAMMTNTDLHHPHTHPRKRTVRRRLGEKE